MSIKIDNNNLVSIILPTYNGSEYLAQSIESCLNQIYDNFELIIVNDGSKKSKEEDIIKSYKDKRIIYLKNDKNLGLSESLNIGFARSSGEYLTWTSDDNCFQSDAVEVMMRYMKEDDRIDFIYSDGYFIDSYGKVTGEFTTSEAWKLWLYNCIGPSFIYRREVYEKIGGYDPEMYLVEDYDYWLRIVKRFRMVKISEKLYFYRVHGASLTANNSRQTVYSYLRKAFLKNATLRCRASYHIRNLIEKSCLRYRELRYELFSS